MRISRKCYNSKYFHIMVKGIGDEIIFKESVCKEKYLKTLLACSVENDIKILAYCMMNTHAHILVYTDEIINLTKLMSSVNTKFAIYYNKRKQRNGYVFRDRYRCENIHTQQYLENCIRYIHKNPVKAGICNHESLYKYSSYNEYIDKSGIVNDEIIKLVFISVIGYISKLNAKITFDDFIEVDNDFGEKKTENIESVIKEIATRKNINLQRMFDEEIVLLGKEILKRCNVTKTQVAQRLNVERTKFSRLINAQRDVR